MAHVNLVNKIVPKNEVAENVQEYFLPCLYIEFYYYPPPCLGMNNLNPSHYPIPQLQAPLYSPHALPPPHHYHNSHCISTITGPLPITHTTTTLLHIRGFLSHAPSSTLKQNHTQYLYKVMFYLVQNNRLP